MSSVLATSLPPRNFTIAFNSQCFTVSSPCPLTSLEDSLPIFVVARGVLRFFAQRLEFYGLGMGNSRREISLTWHENQVCWAVHTRRCSVSPPRGYVLLPDLLTHAFAHVILNDITTRATTMQAQAIHESIADVFTLIFKHSVLGLRNHWKVASGDDISKHRDVTRLPLSQGPHACSLMLTHAFYHAVEGSQTLTEGIVSHCWFLAALEISENERFTCFARRTLYFSHIIANDRITSALAEAWVHVGLLDSSRIRTS